MPGVQFFKQSLAPMPTRTQDMDDRAKERPNRRGNTEVSEKFVERGSKDTIDDLTREGRKCTRKYTEKMGQPAAEDSSARRLVIANQLKARAIFR